MKSLLKILAVSLMACCQLAGGQNAAKSFPSPDPQNACPTNPPASGVQVLSKNYGVDIHPYLKEIVALTNRKWNRFIPKEAKWPTFAQGEVQILFKVLPNGKVKRRDVVLEASSGNPALNYAALKAIEKAKYPPLPKDFSNPSLALRFCFLYNMRSPEPSGADDKAPKS